MHGAIVMHNRNGTGGASVVTPQAAGHTTPAIGPGEWRRIVGMVLGGLHDFLIANARPHWTSGGTRTLFGAIEEAELERIHAQLLTQDIDGRLHGEGRR